MGEDSLDVHIDRGCRVLAGKQEAVEPSRCPGGDGREVGAHIGDGVSAQPQKLAVLIERQLGLGDVVPAVDVGQERLGPVRRPLNGAADLLRRPDAHHLLGVDGELRAEGAADVGRHDAQLVLGRHIVESGNDNPRDMRVLARDIEREAVVARIVFADGRARLHGVRDQPVVNEVELGDVVGLCERRVGRGLVAHFPIEAQVPRRLGVDLRRIGIERLGGTDAGRALLVIDFDELGGILGLGEGFGDHYGDMVADVVDRIRGEERTRRHLGLFTALVGDDPAAYQAANAIGLRVATGVNGHHAW